MPHFSTDQKRRPSLKEELLHLDRDILHLLMRRFTILERMRGKRGYLIPDEEKEIREAWSQNAMRLSSDPKVSSQLFSLLNDITFFPKPKDGEGEEKTQKQGFNLAPPKKPVDIQFHLPASHLHIHTWLTFAAFSGQSCSCQHCLMHDAQHYFLRALRDEGLSITTKDDSIFLETKNPCQCKDISIHCGNDWNVFSLLAGQYIVHPSRVRFSAEGDLKMCNLHDIAHFLPTVGARLSYAVPKNLSFPIRLECSGDIPEKIQIPEKLPSSFVQGLILALPFAEHPVTVNLEKHPDADSIIQNCLGLFEEAEIAAGESSKATLAIEPSQCTVQNFDRFPCEPKVAGFILAFPILLGGKVLCQGLWPNETKARTLLAFFQDLGLQVDEDKNKRQISTKEIAEGGIIPEQDIRPPKELLESEYAPILAALWAGFALKGHSLTFSETPNQTTNEFFAALGISCNHDGILSLQKKDDYQVIWNAPTATWAMALALAATARPHNGFKLGNPGVITELWPQFWTYYNTLPKPQRMQTRPPKEETRRRRIVTDASATITRLSEE